MAKKKPARRRSQPVRRSRPRKASSTTPKEPQSLSLVVSDPQRLMAAVQAQAAQTKLTLSGAPTVNVAAMGTLKLRETQIKALRRKVEDAEVEWRPGRRGGNPEIPYLAHNGYRDRLDEAFGIGGWAMAPAGVPQEKDDVVYAPWALVVGGVERYYAWGEQAYDPKNRQMTYGDAIEGTKSNAIVRVGKELGIARDLWSRRYIAGLKRRVPMSERVFGEGYEPHQEEPKPPATARTGWENEKISDPQYGRLRGIMTKAKRTKTEVIAYLKAHYGYQDGHSILRKDYDAICTAVEKPGPLPTKDPVREPDELLPPITEADIPWMSR